MGILKKIKDLARANFNALIDNLEDPKKMAQQRLLDLEEQKLKAKRLLVASMGSLKRSKDQLSRIKDEIDQLQQQAEMAIKNQREDAAKDLLEKRQQLTADESALKAQLDQEQQTTNKIKQCISTIDDILVDYQQHSTLDIGIQEIAKEDAFNTFSRMEEEIESSEAQIAALQELVKEDDEKEASRDTAEAFDAYFDPKTIERELTALKKKITKK